MPPHVTTWWTEERVQGTVDPQYIHSHLRPDEQLLLQQSPSFGAGLTDDTYLDWILTRARRFFLILVDAGVPDQIFGVIDDSYDDDDLPIAEDVVQDLRLSLEPSKSLNKRFYKTQFRYLIRIVGDSEHIRYAQEETVPIYPLGLKAAVLALSKDGTDNVWLPSDLARVFTRKRVALNDRVTEHGLLSEIASNKRYAHQHIVSIFGSYLFEESVYILLTPAAEYTLKSFLSDIPKHFDNLPKQGRRQILINWPHCLANGLAWLHSSGRPHALICPSNIFVDDKFHIFFGSFDGSGMLSITKRIDDIEAYQYAAPERWKRAVTMQTTGPAKMSGHSGGRTTRKVSVKTEGSDGSESKRSSWTIGSRLDTAMPTATSYAFMPTSKSNFSRLQLGRSDNESVVSFASEASLAARPSDKGSVSTVRSPHSQIRPRDTPSALSYVSSGSSRTVKASITNPIFVAAPEMRTAVVQTWQSAQYDMFAADIFSLGAVILGILTLLCKRSASSFERHRSTKNRTAGRGGGLADASFHANLGQVGVWVNILHDDARKKAKRENGILFEAVERVLRLASQCLSRDPDERITATELEKRLEQHLSSFASTGQLHCRREGSSEPPSPENKMSQLSATEIPRSTMPKFPPDGDITPAPPPVDEWLKLRSKGLVTATIPPPGPDSSLSSLSSFNFDYDVNSETVVEDDRSHATTSVSSGVVSGSVTTDARELAKRFRAKAKRADMYKNWHNNDSAVDPRLSQSPTSPQGGFNYNYQNYSASVSSEEGKESQRSFFFSESSPTSSASYPAPEGPLPPIPQTRSRRKESYDIRPEAFPPVPHRSQSGNKVRQSPRPLDLSVNPKVSGLQQPWEVQRKVTAGDGRQTASIANSGLPSRAKIAQEKGQPLVKNV